MILRQTIFSLIEKYYPLDLHLLTDIGKKPFSLYGLKLLCSVPHLQVFGGRKVELSLLEITSVAVAFSEVFSPQGSDNQTTCSTVKLKKKANGAPAQQHSPAYRAAVLRIALHTPSTAVQFCFKCPGCCTS